MAMSLGNVFLICSSLRQLVVAAGCTNWQSSITHALWERMPTCKSACYTSPLKQFIEPGGQHSCEHAAACGSVGVLAYLLHDAMKACALAPTAICCIPLALGFAGPMVPETP